MEGVGPVTVAQAQEFLRHTNVTLKPVIDLAEDTAVDAWEVPTRIREQIVVRTPFCVFPYSGGRARKSDLHHVVPYTPKEKGGGPGQTRVANLGPLTRFPHRMVTHGRWRVSQPRPGVYLFCSPHGYWFRVDHAGTHALGKHPPPGTPEAAGSASGARPAETPSGAEASPSTATTAARLDDSHIEALFQQIVADCLRANAP